MNDLEQIYKNPNMNVVSIASYDQYHYEQICNSLRNRISMYSVKNQSVKMIRQLRKD